MKLREKTQLPAGLHSNSTIISVGMAYWKIRGMAAAILTISTLLPFIPMVIAYNMNRFQGIV